LYLDISIQRADEKENIIALEFTDLAVCLHGYSTGYDILPFGPNLQPYYRAQSDQTFHSEHGT